MLIKLFEQHPIIAVSEARILGQVKGVILRNNSIVAILAASESEDELYPYTFRNDVNKYIQIPIEDVVIGSDALIIEKSSIVNIYFNNGQVIQRNMGTYTCSGEFVGWITGVEVDSDYTLQGIHIEGGYIESDCILKIGNIVIIDSDSYTKELDTNSEESEIFHQEIEEENDEDTGDHAAFDEKCSEMDIEEIGDIELEENPLLTIEDSEEEVSEAQSEAVFSRYRYLLGKKLINSITVADKTYSDDSIITPKLIESAIINNCILSLIMNAED